jgi:hypothetical protein
VRARVGELEVLNVDHTFAKPSGMAYTSCVRQ